MPTFIKDLPPEIAAQYEAIARRQALNDALTQQTLAPRQTQSTGGKYSRAIPFSPLAGGLNLVQAALLKKGRDREQQALRQLAEDYQKGTQTALQDIEMQRTGAVPYRAADPAGAALRASTDPYLRSTAYPELIADMSKASLAKDRGSYFRTVETRDGRLMLLNTRTGDITDTGEFAAKYDIPTTEALAGARQTGKSEATREFNMSGIGQTIDRAKSLLSGVDPETGEITGDLPTESWLGATQDFLGRVVGYSPKGAKEATGLKAIGGALTAKMPRMEGPQSDKDTMLYREMAAQIGDSTIPIEQRLFALEEVERLWRKYENINKDIKTDSDPLGIRK